MSTQDETGRGAVDEPPASGTTGEREGAAHDDEVIGSALTEAGDDEAGDVAEAEADYGPPFERRSFGGELVWATGTSFVAKMLRIRANGNVGISTEGRADLTLLLTGGRGVLEIRRGQDIDLHELQPAVPYRPDPAHSYRLLALTEVELLTVYTPI